MNKATQTTPLKLNTDSKLPTSSLYQKIFKYSSDIFKNYSRNGQQEEKVAYCEKFNIYLSDSELINYKCIKCSEGFIEIFEA